ncbi:hypothetical protein ACHAPJ_013165 [Fusarium lateritium]
MATTNQLDSKSPHEIHTSISSVSGDSALCAVHGSSETPHLDKILQSRPQAELQGLATAVQNLTHGDQCAKCAVQSAVSIIIELVQEVYTAKKSGKLSKEEKKALKMEVKGLVKGVKSDIQSQKKDFKSNMKSQKEELKA